MKVSYCSCFHAFQDAMLGVGRRWFNWAPGNKPKPSSTFWNRYRCTVCGKEKDLID